MTSRPALRATAALALLLASALPLAAQGTDTAPDAGAAVGDPPPPPPSDEGAPPPPTPDAVPPLEEAVATPPPLPPAEEAVVPPPLPPQTTYFVEENGAAGGPYTLEELRARAQGGTLAAGTLAWTEGMAEWQPASEIGELAPLFAAAPAPSTDTTADTTAADPMTLVVGRWRQQALGPVEGLGMAQFDVTVEFLADGSYGLQGTMTAQVNGQPFPMQVESFGTYTVVRNAQGFLDLTTSGQLTLVPPGGMAPMSEFLTQTTTYELTPEGALRDVATGDMLTPA